MNKKILPSILTLILSILMIHIYAQEIIHTIPAPGLRCQDVTWDGTYLWATENNTRSYYQLDPEDGTVIHSIPYPVQTPYSEGITFDGEYLWACGWEESNGYGSHLFKIDPETGDISASLAYPGDYAGNWPHTQGRFLVLLTYRSPTCAAWHGMGITSGQYHGKQQPSTR